MGVNAFGVNIGLNPIRNARQIIGKDVSAVGTALNLPELGISEKIAGNPAPSGGAATLPGGNTGVANNVDPGTDTGTYTLPDGSFGGGSGGGGASAADLAYYDDQEGILRNLLGSTQATLANGLTQIGDSYNKETGRTAEEQAKAAAGFGVQREDATRSKMGSINQINTGARTLADSVRRLLGMASGNSSSAFKEVAPNAIARDASIKRTGANEVAGRNFRDIDTSEKSTLDHFTQYLQDLAEEKKQKESGLREGILSQEQGIYGDLGTIAAERAAAAGGGYDAVRAATAPSRTAITDRQAALDGLFEQFRTPFTAKPVTVDTPQLNDYTVDPTAINANAQGDGSDPQYSPYSAFLKKKFAPTA